MPKNPKKKKKARQAQAPQGSVSPSSGIEEAATAARKDPPEKQTEAPLAKIPSLLPGHGVPKPEPAADSSFAGNVKTIVNNAILPAVGGNEARHIDPAAFDPYRQRPGEEIKQRRRISPSWHPIGNAVHGASQCSCVSTINQLLDDLYACKKPGQLPRALGQVRDRKKIKEFRVDKEGVQTVHAE